MCTESSCTVKSNVGNSDPFSVKVDPRQEQFTPPYYKYRSSGLNQGT